MNAAVSQRFCTVRRESDVLERVSLVGMIGDGLRVTLYRRLGNGRCNGVWVMKYD